jgi:hypothetical protein
MWCMNSETGEYSIDLGLRDGASRPRLNDASQHLPSLRRMIKHELKRVTGGAGVDPYNSTASRNGNACLDRDSAWVRVRKR